jgi:formylmethanofuran dehydrogenase subunit B
VTTLFWTLQSNLSFFPALTLSDLTLPLHLNALGWQGTVEERMEAVQARKQRMISGALTDQEVRTARIEELKMLFT